VSKKATTTLDAETWEKEAQTGGYTLREGNDRWYVYRSNYDGPITNCALRYDAAMIAVSLARSFPVGGKTKRGADGSAIVDTVCPHCKKRIALEVTEGLYDPKECPLCKRGVTICVDVMKTKNAP